MNRLILEKSDFISQDCVRISGRRFIQLTEVIKSPLGKLCKAGLLNGNTGTAEVCAVETDSLVLKVNLNTPPPPPAPVRLAIALQRPQTFMKVLHIAVTMGVKEILFFHSFKVEKSYWQSPRIAPEAFRKELIEALEQCGDTVLPEISFCRSFKDFADEALPEFSAGTVMLTAHPAGTLPVERKAGESVTLIVGPEGGFTDYEITRLTGSGAKTVTLGARVLRTEYAVAALLGRLI